MADENRMITFTYAKATWDQYKKQTIPDTLECMTKTDINNYLKADASPLSTYRDDQLVPRSRFTPYVGFNIGTGFDNLINTIVLQPDGKILVGGYFTIYNYASQNRLVRLNSHGPRDTSFNIGTGFDNLVYSIVLQPDGKILVGGYFTTFNGNAQNRLIRLNPDGTKDTSFNIDTGFDDWVNPIVLQPDGKILVGGYFTTFNGNTQNRLIRLNPDGTKDTSFNIGTGFNYVVKSIVLQPDGKILVGGQFTTFNGNAQNRLIRLNPDGTKDTSFNIGTGFNDFIYCIALQPDGKILVVGQFTTFNNASQNYFIRLNPDGTKDTSFNIGTGFDNPIYSVAPQPNGKILVGGYFTTFNGNTQNKLVRLNSHGPRDTSFNIGTGFNDWVNSIALQPDGKILVGGQFTTFNGNAQNYLVRLNSDGTKDSI